MLISPRIIIKISEKNSRFSTGVSTKCIWFDLPISSINGAIRNVTPTKSKHINNSRHAVAMIVHLARCDISSGSITFNRKKNNNREHKGVNANKEDSRFMFHIKVGFSAWVKKIDAWILAAEQCWCWCLKYKSYILIPTCFFVKSPAKKATHVIIHCIVLFMHRMSITYMFHLP